MQVRHDWLNQLAHDIATLRHKHNIEVIVVSSGAIAFGRIELALGLKPLRLDEKQAAASVGQIVLVRAWQEALARHNVKVAQILVTLEDTEDRRRHLNGRATIQTLLAMGIVPIINENDTVATSEIRFGDNDRLAARVAQMVSADHLLLLSDIDGLYSADPRKDANAKFIPLISEITPEIAAMAGVAPKGISSGGMVTKIAAAKIAVAAGCKMLIANGRGEGCLGALITGAARCSWFLPNAEPLTARKRWIAAHVKSSGRLRIDAGAISALKDGKSLLPVGLVEVIGEFSRGDLVEIVNLSGEIIGCGLVGYDADEARAVKGLQMTAVESTLGYSGRSQLIHSDDLVI